MIGALIKGVAGALAPYKLAAEIAVFGAAGLAVLAAGHNFLEHERDIGRAEVRAEWDKAKAEAKLAAAAQTETWRADRDAAATVGAKRDETIRSLAASAAAAAGGLRDAIARTDRGVPDYSADALRALTSTYGQLLAECSGRYQGVASEADRLNSEKRTLIEAWPAVAAAMLRPSSKVSNDVGNASK